MKILILAPTKAEYTATLQSLEQVKHGDNVIVRYCGVGPALASACLASEDPTKYDAVILIGYCGSNKVDYPVGSMVYPRFADYFSTNPELDCLEHLNVTYDLLGIDEVTIYSSEHFVTDTPLTGLFDMEAASLATVLADYAPDVPLVVARMVSDNPNDPNNETAFDAFDIDDFSGLLAGAFELIDSHFYWSEEK